MILRSRISKSLLPLLQYFLPSITLLLLAFHNCSAQDSTTVTNDQFIHDPQTLTSWGGIFKLGFFSPPNSTNRYVGIWYNKIPRQTIVWVANRDNPLNDSSGVLRIGNDGNLVVLDGREFIVWTTNVPNIVVNNSIVEIMDSGNLVLRQITDRRTLWESFEYPSDTLLSTMDIGGSRRIGGRKKQLTSWTSESNPSTGTFSAGLELIDTAQLVIWSGSQRVWRSGPWNGRIFIGMPVDSVNGDGFYSNSGEEEDSTYIGFKYADNSSLIRYALDHHGVLFGENWDEESNKWDRIWSSTDNDECDVYGKCGPFGSCNKLETPICSCLSGFTPKSTNEWSKGNWSDGCVREKELKCERINNSTIPNTNDKFLKLENMKVPDFTFRLASFDVDECVSKCVHNCSCVAFWYDDNVGCMTWGGSLVDIQKFSKRGVNLHIRVSNLEIDPPRGEVNPPGLDPPPGKINPPGLNPPSGKDNPPGPLKKKIIIPVLVGAFTISVCAYSFWWWITKQKGKEKKVMQTSVDMENDYEETTDQNRMFNNSDLKVVKFEELAIATDNFCGANKLGEGGFGSVYKGKFMDGQEIAVKRLSKGSVQGLEEFKNEVLVILKVQHRNLVKLLGCCIEGEEKMLIYEYMPNNSLDAFLFDHSKRELLDWSKRFQIIEGISRGILYLHRDSRLRVIHRDIKASNILLDEELNPKISDFGMARIFGGNELQANTGRVVGTFGYMSPEYIMEGRFSEKSDVFSFGVLLLEIVSGKKNTNFHHQEISESLLGFAWHMWNEGKMELLIDPTLMCESIFDVDILRCIHVGLLCVQEFANDRPTMSSTLSMLTSEITTLPSPKQPAFMERRIRFNTFGSNSFQQRQESFCITNSSSTTIQGR